MKLKLFSPLHKSKVKILLLASLASLLLLASVFALVSPKVSHYKLSTGGMSSSGNLVLRGSFGQLDARNQLTGGVYTLTGGFWGPSGARTGDLKIYIPLSIR